MKKTDLVYLFIILAYSTLFYNQWLGINLFIFNLLLAISYRVINKNLFKSWQGVLAVAGVILTGTTSLLYGNVLSFTVSFISISTLSLIAFSNKSSVIMSIAHFAYNLVLSMFFILESIGKRLDKIADKSFKKTKRTVGLIVIPIIVLLLFFFLYRNANPLFKEQTDFINLDFISLKWFAFTLIGSVILFGLFFPNYIEDWTNKDLKASNKASLFSGKYFYNYIGAKSEFKLGITLLILLNVLLFFVNLTDASYLIFGADFPSHLTRSELVHNGVGNLILSIVLAIIIVIYFFRGRNNFLKTKSLKYLTITWLLQNSITVVFTLFKNNYYVFEHGLTYKRIGVYIYLALTLIGITITIYKVINANSFWFMVRKLGWSFYMFGIISAFIPWNTFIANTNINLHLSYNAKLDLDYFSELGVEGLMVLEKRKEELKISHSKNYVDHIDTYKFLLDYKERDWRSQNIQDNYNYNLIINNYEGNKMEYDLYTEEHNAHHIRY